MALTLDGTNGIVSSGSITTQSSSGVIFSDSSALTAASSPYVLKNRIINGAMDIDQRNAGASVTNTAGNVYTLDRWAGYGSQASKYTIQQSTTAPTGFVNSLKVTSSSAYTVGSSEFFIVQQKVEGLNCADLGWGTASAETVTLSFKVYSSLTGTFGGAILNYDNSRSYPFSYTVSSANTWTNISVTIAGDTSGTWLTTSGVGIQIVWGLGAGSAVSGTAGSWSGNAYYSATGATSVVGTNGATFYITGVQLEIGSTATPFERRLYGQELINCQRYYETNFPPGTAPGASLPGFASTSSSNGAPNEASGVQFSVKKRATPTIVLYNVVTGTAGQVYRVSDGASIGATPTHSGSSGIGFLALATSSANGYYWNYTASAEL